MLQENMDISVVVPLYNESDSLNELCEWLIKTLGTQQFAYEIILVDDGSRDDSWEKVRVLSQTFSSVKGIRLNRNYGKSAALNTGFKHAKGKVVVTMDADLQDDPEEIPALYHMIVDEGYDLVSGWKQNRKDPLSKTIPTKLFNATTRLFSGIRLHDFNCGLKAYKDQVVKSIDIYGEMHRYIPVIAKWAGFSHIGEKKVRHHRRKYGKTKYGGISRFIFGFLDLLSITFVTRFKKRPMHFFGTMGTLSFIFGFLISLGLIGQKVYDNWYLGQSSRSVTDQPLFFLALTAVIIGVQLFLVGFLAEMLLLTNLRNDDYVIAATLNLKNKQP